MPRGHLFIVDGPDGSGKTTAAAVLADELYRIYGDKSICFRHPGGTDAGVEIRRILKSPKFKLSTFAERLLFAADSIQTVEEIVNPGLERGCVILGDRWAPFTDHAYGAARGISPDDISKVHSMFPMPKIDALFVFSLPFEEIKRRKLAMLKVASEQHDSFETAAGSTHEKPLLNEEFLKQVHGFYEQAFDLGNYSLASQVAMRCANSVVRVDSSQSPRQVVEFILSTIKAMVG
jgi:thymidylate kinase